MNLAVSVFIAAASILLLFYLSRGAIFVPTARAKVALIIKLAQIMPGEQVADLGSGDGRIVIALAQAGAMAHGYEINPLLVWWSRYLIRQAGLQKTAIIHWQDFWNADFSQYSAVTVFGIDHIMKRLGQKILRETKAGTRVISYAFPFPGWVPTTRERGVYTYVAN
jgi:ribosomal protein L11 methylase PrmA